MALYMEKPWRPLTAAEVATIPGQLGVYEIADRDGSILKLGMANALTKFGLKEALGKELAARGDGFQFRLEINMQYTTRYKELLLVHEARHGAPPPENDEPVGRYGRLSPA